MYHFISQYWLLFASNLQPVWTGWVPRCNEPVCSGAQGVTGRDKQQCKPNFTSRILMMNIKNKGDKLVCYPLV